MNRRGLIIIYTLTVFSILYTGCISVSENEKVLKDYNNYIVAIREHRAEILVEYIHPEYFNYVTEKDVLKTFVKSKDSSIITNYALNNMSEIFEYEGIKYTHIQYTLSIKTDLYKLRGENGANLAISTVIARYNELYGKDNVAFDKEKYCLKVDQHNDIIAVKDPVQSGWKFLNCNKQNLTFIKNIIPSSILEKFNFSQEDTSPYIRYSKLKEANNKYFIQDDSSTQWTLKDSLFLYEVNVDTSIIKDSYDNIRVRSVVTDLKISCRTNHIKYQEIRIPRHIWQNYFDSTYVFILEDMNFDGYNDFRILSESKPDGTVISYNYWIYNTRTRRFERDYTYDKFQNPQFNADSKTLRANYTIDNGGVSDALFKYADSCFILVHEDVYKLNKDYEYEIIYTNELINGELIRTIKPDSYSLREED